VKTATSSMETAKPPAESPSLSRRCEAWNACSEQDRCQSGGTQFFHDTSP
jgi:hypothetical protein